MGIIIAGVILMCLAPLCAAMARGHIAQPTLATPFGLGAAGLVAFFFGGWTNVWGGVIPAFFLAMIVGGCATYISSPARLTVRPIWTLCSEILGLLHRCPYYVDALPRGSVSTVSHSSATKSIMLPC